jgi:hypothetical protein
MHVFNADYLGGLGLLAVCLASSIARSLAGLERCG